MHELTKQCEKWYDKKITVFWRDLDKEVIVPYMTQQAKELNEELTDACSGISWKETIDTSFGLSKPTLEEKLFEHFNDRMTVPGGIEMNSLKESVNICRSHFKENPGELQ